MRSLLYTHTDLDGCGSAVLATLASSLESSWDVIFLDNVEVSDTVEFIVTSAVYKKYDRIVFADLPVTMATAEILNNINLFTSVYLLDHHKSTLPVQDKYPQWAKVVVEADGVLQCGTSLFYSTFCSSIRWKIVDLFVEAVRAWDTWTWSYDGNEFAENLQLLHVNSKSNIAFCEMMASNLREDMMINSQNNIIINHAKMQEHKYLESMKNSWFEIEYSGMKFAAVIAGQYSSKLGNIISKEHPEYVGAVMLTEHGLSFRTVRTDVDLSEIARSIGGGGHKQAAGASFDEATKKFLFEAAFDKLGSPQ